MLQHVIKWAVFAAAWRQAKPYFAGTLLAVVGVLLVDTLHSEFVEYIRLSKDLDPNVTTTGAETGPGRWLLVSFAAKWLGFAVIAIGWGVYCRRVYRLQRIKPEKPAKNSKVRVDTKTSSAAEPTPAELIQQQKDDAAFDFLRNKGKLQGRGDKILKRGQASD